MINYIRRATKFITQYREQSKFKVSMDISSHSRTESLCNDAICDVREDTRYQSLGTRHTN